MGRRGHMPRRILPGALEDCGLLGLAGLRRIRELGGRKIPDGRGTCQEDEGLPGDFTLGSRLPAGKAQGGCAPSPHIAPTEEPRPSPSPARAGPVPPVSRPRSCAFARMSAMRPRIAPPRECSCGSEKMLGMSWFDCSEWKVGRRVAALIAVRADEAALICRSGGS